MSKTVYTSPNLSIEQVKVLIGELNSLIISSTLRSIKSGTDEPCCRLRIEESPGRTIVDVIPPGDEP